MRSELLKPLEGTVTTLVLSGGIQVTTRIIQVDEKLNEAICSKLMVFQVADITVPNPQKEIGPGNMPQYKVGNMFFGQPLYECPSQVRISLDHIMFTLTPSKGLQDKYVQDMSGIVPASGNVLDQLAAFDLSKIGRH